MAVDLKVPEGIPQTGVFTSDQGHIKILGEDIVRVSRASFTLDNGVSVYRESRKRTGITYAGLQRVTGQITRAFVNAAESKLVIGQPVGGELFAYKPGPGVIAATQLATLLALGSFKITDRATYPPRVDISLIINEDRIGLVGTDQATTVNPGKMQTFTCHNAIITNHVLAWDSRGLITSGPLNFLGSAFSWDYV